MVARQFRVLEAASSSPATSTIKVRLSVQDSLIFIFRDSNQGSPTARKYSLLFGGAYAPNDAIYRKRYAFTNALLQLLVLLGRVVVNSYQLFPTSLPATSTKKQPKTSHFDLFSAVFYTSCTKMAFLGRPHVCPNFEPLDCCFIAIFSLFQKIAYLWYLTAVELVGFAGMALGGVLMGVWACTHPHSTQRCGDCSGGFSGIAS